MTSSGCLGLGGPKTAKVETPLNPDQIPANVVIKKKEEGPPKQPSANLLTKLAVMREGQAEKTDDPDIKTRHYDEARRNFQEALKVDPNNLEAMQGLGRVYIKMGDFEHAVDTYQKALTKNPRHASLWVDLAMGYNRKKSYPEAIQCLTKALEIDPENRDYMKTMGFTLARAGQNDQALIYLTRAMGQAGAHYNIARMMIHMNQLEQGRQQLSLALQANPNHEPSRQLLANLDQPNPPAGGRISGLILDGPGQ